MVSEQQHTSRKGERGIMKRLDKIEQLTRRFEILEKDFYTACDKLQGDGVDISINNEILDGIEARISIITAHRHSLMFN